MIVCTNCGNHNEDSDEFCGSCGKFLEWVGQRIEVPSEPEPAPDPEPEPDPVKSGLIDRVKAAVGIDEQGRPVGGPAPASGATARVPAGAGIQAVGAQGVAAPPEADGETARLEADAAEAARRAEMAEEEVRRRAEEEARARARAEEARIAQEQAQARAMAEAEAARAAQEEARRRADDEARAQEEAERKRQAEAEAARRAEAEKKALAEAEAQAAAAAESARQAQLDAGVAGAGEEEQAAAGAEAARQAQQAAEAAHALEEARRVEEEARAAAAAEAAALEEAQARARQELEARRAAEDEARRRADEEARAKAEAEARALEEDEARRRAAEEARAKAAAEARAKQEDEARRRAAALLQRSRPAPVAPSPEPPPAPTQVPRPAATAAQKPTAPQPVTPQVTPQPVAQQPVAQQPSSAKAPPRPDPKVTAPEKVIKPGDLVCGQCGQGNDPTRKFCRKCGNSLVQAVAAKKLPWWKTLFSGRGGGISKEASSRAGKRAQAREAKYKAQIAMAYLRRGAMLLAALGVIGAFALPSPRGIILSRGSSLLSGARDLINPQFEPVNAVTVVASSSVPGHEPNFANDLGSNTYWAEGAEGPGVGQTISFSFETKVDLAKVIVSSGAADSPDNFLKQPRPRELHLVFDNGGSTDIILKDQLKPQSFGLKGAKGVGKVDVVISSVYAGQSGADTAIAEVEFKKKG